MLPADVRIKIVFALANAGDGEEELEADVSGSEFEVGDGGRTAVWGVT